MPEAIAACRRAGVRVVMLTGDHPTTAHAVAVQVGLNPTIETVSGDNIGVMSDSALLALLSGDGVFARIGFPEQKLRIVSLLRSTGEVVVVTGDGINGPPLPCGPRMSGSPWACEGPKWRSRRPTSTTSRMTTCATIVAAVEEGRAIKANIRRFVSYVFTSNVAELMPFIAYVFFAVPFPLAIIQVLAIDLGTDLLPALALGAEPPMPSTMIEAPELPSRPLLTRSLAIKTFLFFGLIEGAFGLISFFAYYWAGGWRPLDTFHGYSSAFEHRATTMTFLGIVAGQIGCLFANRGGNLRARLSFRSNGWILVGLGFEIGLSLFLIYVPGVNEIASMEPVSPVGFWSFLSARLPSSPSTAPPRPRGPYGEPATGASPAHIGAAKIGGFCAAGAQPAGSTIGPFGPAGRRWKPTRSVGGIDAHRWRSAQRMAGSGTLGRGKLRQDRAVRAGEEAGPLRPAGGYRVLRLPGADHRGGGMG